MARLPFVMCVRCVCETGPFKLRVAHRLSVFESGVLSKMFGLRKAEVTRVGEKGVIMTSVIGRRRRMVLRCTGMSGRCSGMVRGEERRCM